MKTLLVTLGDSGGLGPELAARYFGSSPLAADGLRVLVIGSLTALAHHSAEMGVPPFLRTLAHPDELGGLPPGVYGFEPEALRGSAPVYGRPHVSGGRASGESLALACDLLTSGKAHGLVTGPLHKAMLQEAGYDFPGHTEFLAERAGLAPDEVTMHLCGPRLRVSLVTTHPPLRDVPDMITRDSVKRAIAHTADLVRRLAETGDAAAPVAVCGLNPHAGETGKIGREELDVILPAIEDVRIEGYEVEGPFPADTVFGRAVRGEFSAVVAMYHDQGLGPLKLLHFGEAVNVTLGLPFVRTSVDHGTGFDIVGAGKADVGSFRAAFELAARLI